MARPETVEDIEESNQKVQLLSFNMDHLLVYAPDVLPKLMKAVTIATSKYGATKGYGDSISIKKNQAGLEKQLEQDQRQWDTQQKLYNECLADPASAQEYQRYSVNVWAKKEGLQEIVWPEAKSE